MMVCGRLKSVHDIRSFIPTHDFVNLYGVTNRNPGTRCLLCGAVADCLSDQSHPMRVLIFKTRCALFFNAR